ncbi:hypothetical protein GGR53DRAFT_517459 [Hypoxylon sp. FL1150]|nr:hypothetical protein GGR53DRAFT_517459 [Hypoxylon sp. FL1150]
MCNEHTSFTEHFGDPNAQPPTPKQTPTSAGFPTSVFETPKNSRASFEESSGWTPHFAEEYSVFNSTPGNLRGSHGPFVDFSAATPYQSNHKRPLSAEDIAAEIATHVTHFSPNPNLPLPPVDPSRRLQSSPGLVTGQSPTEPGFQSGLQQQPKKLCRPDTAQGTKTQTATPPPSTHKGQRRLAPKLQTGTMQNEGFEQEFIAGTPQQQHMANFMTTPTDMFGFGDSNVFWDNEMSAMDIDFATSGHVFQTPSHHRPMSSIDWGKSNEIFQQTGAVPPQQSQENVAPARKERALAPKPPPQNLDTSAADTSMFGTSFPASADEPFNMNQGGGVDPGLLFTRPPSSGMEPAPFDPMSQPPLLQAFSQPEPVILAAKPTKRGGIRRTGSTKGVAAGKKVNRAAVSSPIKPSERPGLSRSFSEKIIRKPAVTANLPHLAPATRPVSQSSGRSVSGGSRSNGRISPLKNHNHRLPSLSSIPETPRPRTQTSVKFTIDSKGRARAETTTIVVNDDDDDQMPTVRRRREQHGNGSRSWASSENDDDSSTDDEPIIIPSRNTSFALPQPQKPSSYPLHSSQRSVSNHSTSSLGIYYNEFEPAGDDPESEAETVMNMAGGSNGGDAASELRKLVQSRQKRTSHESLRPAYGSGSSAVTPASIKTSKLHTPAGDRGNRIRCVCNTASNHVNGNNYMVQCESCEMWLHGKCINITRQTLPRVYICAFCANTPNAHGMRGREVRRTTGGSNPRVAMTNRNKSLYIFFYSFTLASLSVLVAWFSSLTIYQSTASSLFKMATHNIVVFSGDHCGPEVVAEGVKEHLIGGSADAVLLGAIGGPEWGTGAVRPEQGILKLRKEMQTYGNLRPCFFPSDSLVEFSPLKAEVCRGTNFTVLYSKAEVQRITRLAAHLALASDPPAPVWSLDKANVLASSRLWRQVVTETMANEFPQLKIQHQLIDSAAMIMIKNPRGLNGVVVTSNIFGDIISDEASVIPGSIGLSPSASLSGVPDGKSRCNGIYEPIHGSAPDISGKGIVNPIGTILSVAMMFRYSFALPKEADAIEKAVKNVLDSGIRTKDLGGSAGTKEIGEAIVAELAKILKN